MTQYLLSIYQPDGPPPPPEQLGTVMQKMAALTEEARNADVWVFGGGLHPAGTATVVRYNSDERLVTDGPFIEGKELLDGPDAPAAGLPVEVRPFQHDSQDV